MHSSLTANLTAANNNHRFTNRFMPFQRIDSGNALGMINSGNAARHNRRCTNSQDNYIGMRGNNIPMGNFLIQDNIRIQFLKFTLIPQIQICDLAL